MRDPLPARIARALAARRPTVIRGGAPFCTPEDVFRAAIAAGVRRRAGREGVRLRAFDGGVALPEPPDCLPSDGSLGGWLDRVGAEPGVVINNLQAVDLTLWRAVRRVLGPIFAARGMPAGGASLELFSGRYRRGFFGVHKDDQDVITFVVEGTKTFELWPFESLEGEAGPLVAGVPTSTRKRPKLTLRAEPGDVIVWPAEWWHLAVNQDGEQVTTLGVGLFRGADPSRLFAEAVTAAVAEGEVPEPPALRAEDAGGAVDALLASLAQHRARAESTVLGWITGYGFHTLPEPLEDPPLAPVLQAVAPTGIGWHRQQDQLLVGACGRVLALPWEPTLVALLSRISNGRPFEVERLARAYPALEPELVEAILQELLATYALEPVDGAPSSSSARPGFSGPVFQRKPSST